MYANLEVHVGREPGVELVPGENPQGPASFHAWSVVFAEGYVTISVDEAGENDKYPVPGPNVRIPLAGRRVEVVASF